MLLDQPVEDLVMNQCEDLGQMRQQSTLIDQTIAALGPGKVKKVSSHSCMLTRVHSYSTLYAEWCSSKVLIGATSWVEDSGVRESVKHSPGWTFCVTVSGRYRVWNITWELWLLDSSCDV